MAYQKHNNCMRSANERFQNNYDFLRLFAACCILFTHSFNLLGLSSKEPLMWLSQNRYDFSFVGLCIFFSISGYLIVKSAATAQSFLHYCWKRFLRIQPLLIIVCMLSMLLLGPLVSSLSLTEYFSSFSTWTYGRNIFPAAGIQFKLPGVFSSNVADQGVNGSLWTLIVEERLYILVGILFLFKKYAAKLYLLFGVLLNLVFLLSFFWKQYPFLHYFSEAPFFYALLFINAGIVYVTKVDLNRFLKFRSGLALFMVCIVSLCMTDLTFLQPFILPLLVIALAQAKGIANRSGQWGDFTYGVYIFSFPVQQLLIHYRFATTPSELFLTSFLLVLPLSVLSWHLLEKKILAFKNRVGIEAKG